MKTIFSWWICVLFGGVFSCNSFSQKFYYDTVTLNESVEVYTQHEIFYRDITGDDKIMFSQLECRVPRVIDASVRPIDLVFSTGPGCSIDAEELLLYSLFVETEISNDTLYVSEIITGSMLFKGVIVDDKLVTTAYAYKLILEDGDNVTETGGTSIVPFEIETLKNKLDSEGDTLELYSARIIYSLKKKNGDVQLTSVLINELNVKPKVWFTENNELVVKNIPGGECVSIYNLHGVPLYKYQIGPNGNSVDKHRLKPGIYIYTVHNNTGKIIYTQKMVIPKKR